MDNLTQFITQLTGWINTITGNNHFMAAAILTGLAIIARNVPRRIFEFINRQLFYVVNLTDSYDTNGATNTVRALFKWHQKSRWSKYSRNVQLRDSGDSLEDRILTGVGRHIFFHKGVFFWMNVSLHEPKSGNQGEVNRVTIRTFIWNRDTIKDILLDIYPVNFDKPAIYAISGGQFGSEGTEVGRIDVMYGEQKQMIDIEQYNEIDRITNRFVNNRQWYRDNSTKYKETFLLYGEPGTGKSTLVRHFASRYNLPVVIVTPTMLNSLNSWLISRQGQPIIVLLEDIDNSHMLHVEDNENENISTPESYNRYSNHARIVKSDRSVFLNFFDGVAPLENVLIFMTTNHIEKLHSSVYRPGRVDHLFNITYPTHEKIADILEWELSDPRMEIIRQYNLKDFPLAVLANLKRAVDVQEVKQLLHKGKEFFILEELSGVKYTKLESVNYPE